MFAYEIIFIYQYSALVSIQSLRILYVELGFLDPKTTDDCNSIVIVAKCLHTENKL